jgi:hypothetical protein
MGGDLSAGVGSEDLQTSGLTVASRTRSDPRVAAKRDKRGRMQSSRARREQGCERYLHLEHGVFANTLHSGALDHPNPVDPCTWHSPTANLITSSSARPAAVKSLRLPLLDHHSLPLSSARRHSLHLLHCLLLSSWQYLQRPRAKYRTSKHETPSETGTFGHSHDWHSRQHSPTCPSWATLPLATTTARQRPAAHKRVAPHSCLAQISQTRTQYKRATTRNAGAAWDACPPQIAARQMPLPRSDQPPLVRKPTLPHKLT